MTQFVKSLYQASKLFFLLLLIIFSVNVKAYSLDDFAADINQCLASPCSCGQPSVSESWGPDGSSMSTLLGDVTNYPDSANMTTTNTTWQYANQACMPFNRFAGRVGCLKQFQPPLTPLLPTYRVYCAEADPNSSATNPSIILRMQACNIFSCFTKSTSLNAGGAQCVTWPTQYGIPTIRFCARVSANRISQMPAAGNYLRYSSSVAANAVNYVPTGSPLDGTVSNIPDPNGNFLNYSSSVPADAINYVPTGSPLDGKPAIQYTEDDGYMYHFLDTNGYPRPDAGIQSGSGYTVFLPKICLYEDPSYVEALTGAYMEDYRLKQPNGTAAIDTYDRNIYSQFLQYGSNGGYPNPGFLAFMANTVNQNMVVERKFFFTGKSSNFYNSSPNQIPNNGVYSDTSWNNGNSPWGSTTDSYANWVNNFVVKKYNSLGCTHLPIGPYPPPFCPTLTEPPSGVTMQPICATTTFYNPNGSPPGYVANYIDSTLASPCVKSTVNNNFIHNAVRVSVDSITPICLPLNATGSVGTGFCAKVNLYGASLSAVYNLGDILGVCQGANPNTPCVTPPPVCTPAGAGTPPPLDCVATDITPASGKFRVVYGMQASNGGSITPLKGYPSDIASNVCSSNNSLYPCVTIYGVNTGAYSDVVLDLGNSGNVDYSKKYYSTSINLSDMNNFSYNITPYVSFQGVGQPSISSIPGAGNLSLPPNSICVSYENSVNGKIKNAGCIPRAAPPQLRSYCCSNPGSPVTVENNDLSTTSVACNTPPFGAPTCNWSENSDTPTHYNTNPNMIVGLDFTNVTAGTSSVPMSSSAYTLVSPRNLSGNDGSSTATVQSQSLMNYNNLIGYLVDTLVVDSNYYMPPFTSNQVIPTGNTISIMGNYVGCTYPQGGSAGNLTSCNYPLNMNGTISSVGQTGLGSNTGTPLPPYYLGGLEYVNGKYQRGGSYFYAGPISDAKCHVPIVQSNGNISYDDSYCVLTKLNYADALSCGDFNSKFTANNISQCPNNATSCTPAIPSSTVQFNSSYGGGTAISKVSCVVTTKMNNVTTSTNQTCYQTDPSLTLPVCSPSTLPQDRVLPRPLIVDANNNFNPPAPASPAPPLPYAGLTSAQIANIALNSTDYYNSGTHTDNTFCALGANPGAGSILFDSNKCAMRDKTMFEIGAFTPIPYMFCPAVTIATEASGYATWTLAPLGAQSTGSCETGYAPKLAAGLSTRTCKADMNNNVFLDPFVDANSCSIINCSAITTAANNTGYATWTSASYGGASTGTCATGYSAPSGGLATRLCDVDASNNPFLAPITTATTCLKNCDAESGTLANGWANWSAASYGNTSTPTCPAGFSPPSGGFATRTCSADGTLSALPAGQTCSQSVTLTSANNINSITFYVTNPNATIRTSSPAYIAGQNRIAGNANKGCMRGVNSGTNDSCWNYTVYTVQIGYPSYWSVINNSGGAGSNNTILPNGVGGDWDGSNLIGPGIGGTKTDPTPPPIAASIPWQETGASGSINVIYKTSYNDDPNSSLHAGLSIKATNFGVQAAGNVTSFVFTSDNPGDDIGGGQRSPFNFSQNLFYQQNYLINGHGGQFLLWPWNANTCCEDNPLALTPRGAPQYDGAQHGGSFSLNYTIPTNSPGGGMLTFIVWLNDPGNSGGGW